MHLRVPSRHNQGVLKSAFTYIDDSVPCGLPRVQSHKIVDWSTVGAPPSGQSACMVGSMIQYPCDELIRLPTSDLYTAKPPRRCKVGIDERSGDLHRQRTSEAGSSYLPAPWGPAWKGPGVDVLQ